MMTTRRWSDDSVIAFHEAYAAARGQAQPLSMGPVPSIVTTTRPRTRATE